MDHIITLHGVSLRYRLIRERRRSFQAHIIDYLKGKRVEKETLWALRNISLKVRKGETLGIIGPNGAGKSTLLKVISGVIKPTEGTVTANGKIAPLIELAAGFDDELTGRENIFLNASILGFSRKEIEKRVGSIVDFSELQNFIDTPLKHYSSGMVARLAFSIATEANPEILIIDEVLAVGDNRFKGKSTERISEFKNRGVTILFVSHEMEQVRSVCDRVLWIDHGEQKMIGDPYTVSSNYLSA